MSATPSSDLRARLRASVAKHPAPTRSEGRRRSVLLHAAAIVAMLAVFEGAGGLSHSAGRPIALTLGIAGVVSLIAAATTVFTQPRSGSMLARPARTYLALGVLAPALVFVGMIAWNGLYQEPFQRIGFRCMALTVSMGGFLAAATFYLRRGRGLQHVGAQGAAIGVMAGVWATVLVDLWCPLTNAPHVLVGHVIPVAFLGLVGALVGRRVLPLRAR